MKSKKQCNPYLTHELHQHLKTYCATKGVSESSVVESALREYFADSRDSALVMRRLDRNDRALERVRREVTLLSELVSSWTRVWYAHTPTLATGEKDAAQRSAAQRHGHLLDHVGKRFNAGKTLSTDIIIDSVADPTELAEAAARAGAKT